MNDRTKSSALAKYLVAATLVISLAMGVIMYFRNDAPDDVKESLTRGRMVQLSRAMLQFEQDVGHLPASFSLLYACSNSEDVGCTPWVPSERHGWHGPYLLHNADAELDGWGKHIIVDSIKLEARIVSFGPDGVYDGAKEQNPCMPMEDDIVLCLPR